MAINDFVTTVSGYLSDLLIKKPEYIDHKIGRASPMFRMLKVVKSDMTFYLTVPYASGGGVMGYNLDSTSASLGYTAPPSIIQPSDNLTDIVSFYRMTDEAIDRIGSDESILKDYAKRIYDTVAENLTMTLKKLFYLPEDRQIVAQYTDGGSGTTISTSGTSIALDADPTASSPTFGAWYLRIGDVVDIYEGTNTTASGSALVTAIDTDRKTVTLQAIGSNITVTAGATIYLYLQGFYGKNVNAYGYIAKVDRTLHGIDSTSNPFWDGQVVDAGGTASLTVDKLRELSNKIDASPFDIDTGELKYAFTTKEQIQSLENDIAGTISIQTPAKDERIKYGWGITVDGIMVQYDPMVAPGVVFMPNFNYLELRRFSNPEWVKIGGQVIHPYSASQFQVKQVVLKHRMQIATSLPNAQGKIHRLSGDFSFS